MKIKVLYTIPNFNTAGSGKVLYDLAKGLDPEHFDVSIACRNDKGEFFKNIKALGFPIYLIGSTVSLRPYGNLFSRINPFKQFLKTHNFDIVHSWHWSSNWSEVLACRLSGIPYVYTKKAMGFKSIHWKIKSFLSNFIVTINDEMHHYFPYRKKQQLIPLGIDLDHYYYIKHENTINDSFKIVTVSNLVPVKGIETLILAVHKLASYDINLSIIGDYKHDYGQSLLRLVSELNMENKVHFIGKMMDVRPFLEKADLYVIPTLDEGRREGMPMALVEAMAMGLPVLGSNISGIKYVLMDFPELLFEASDIKQMSEKIKMIFDMTHSERAEIGKKLRRYCENNFSFECFVASHEYLYKTLIE